jgi:hypothetical protein
MDPNETLKLLREVARECQDHADSSDASQVTPDFEDLTEQAENMASLFGGLDQWLSAGGFFPELWLVHQHGRGRGKRETPLPCRWCNKPLHPGLYLFCDLKCGHDFGVEHCPP